MKYLVFTILSIFLSFFSDAQNPLSLKECHELAVQNYPLVKQKDLIKQFEEERIQQLSKNFLPKVDLNLQASYQSDVTSLNASGATGIPIGLLPNLSKDNYKVNLDIQQLIWDGGITKMKKKIESMEGRIKEQNLAIELYKVKDHINQLFFSNLLLDKQIKILKLTKENLQKTIKELTLLVEQGMALQSDLDMLKAESITIDQKVTELKHNQISVLQMLSIYINKEISPTQVFALNTNTKILELTNMRPELKSFDLNLLKFEINKSVIDASKRPFIVANGKFGYGRPALNMLSNDFDTYYKLSVALKWNLWDWNKKKSEKNLLSIQSAMINKQKETFKYNINIQHQKLLTEIQKYQDFIEQDVNITELRSNILKTSKSKLNSGTITSASYITEFNKEIQSKLNFEYHKIQLELAKQNLKQLLGHN
jgi:outer membrane protein TolC